MDAQPGGNESKDDKNHGLRIAVTIAALLLTIVHHYTSFKLDPPTIVLLVVAALPWLYPLFKTIELLGVKVELRDLQKKVKEASKSLQLLEDNSSLPGKKDNETADSPPPPLVEQSIAAKEEEKDAWETDPNSGKFGGEAQRNGRVLEAVITPAVNSRSAASRIILRVRSTDSSNPLTGDVTMYLHPTFGRWKKYDITAKNGVAQDTITSWGVFTVGAIADKGQTKLELDLRKVPGGTEKFYQQ